MYIIVSSDSSRRARAGSQSTQRCCRLLLLLHYIRPAFSLSKATEGCRKLVLYETKASRNSLTSRKGLIRNLDMEDPTKKAPEMAPPPYPGPQPGFVAPPAMPMQPGYPPQAGAPGYPPQAGAPGYPPQAAAPGYPVQPGAPPPMAPTYPAYPPVRALKRLKISVRSLEMGSFFPDRRHLDLSNLTIAGTITTTMVQLKRHRYLKVFSLKALGKVFCKVRVVLVYVYLLVRTSSPADQISGRF